jgi:hypothetical protein
MTIALGLSPGAIEIPYLKIPQYTLDIPQHLL